MKTTLVIDGNNLIHRTFWVAKTQSKNAENIDTPLSNFHIYFTLNAVFSYVSKYNPTETIIVWDEKQDYSINTRKSEYAEYKGNRSKDTSPHENNAEIQRLLGLLGIVSIYPRELEADDIVAYICHNKEGKKVIISVDKDFLQLVDKNVTLFDPIRKKEYIYETFTADTGWAREHWLQAKCIKGDTSDNVTGIGRFGDLKIKKFISGDLKLTNEQQEIYDRNMRVFSLEAFKLNEAESSYYKDQLAISRSYKWIEFIESCKEYKFNSILNKKESWFSTFILANKLQTLFG
jgi:5'-3' exonuclease